MISLRTLTSTTEFVIEPKPKSQLSLYRSSNTETGTNMATIGEYLVYRLTITLPEGTTLSPNVTFRLPNATSSPLGMVNATVLSGRINTTSFGVTLQDLTGDGVLDTATISSPVLINEPDNIDSNDQVVMEVYVMVLPASVNTQKLAFVSQFQYNNGTTTIVEKEQSFNATIVQPELAWKVIWDEPSGDAGNQVDVSVVVQHTPSSTAPADDVMIVAQLAPHYLLIPGSIESAFSTAILGRSSDNEGWEGIAYIPRIKVGETVIVTFSTTLNVSVLASSVIYNGMALNYSSAFVGGRKLSLSASSSLAILPIPAYKFSLASTSLTETTGTSVTVGEVITYEVVINLPAGTTRSPNITVSVPIASGLSVLNASVNPLQSHISGTASIALIDSNHDSINDAASIVFDSIVCQPTVGVRNTVVFQFVAVVLQTATAPLTATSQFSHSNGTSVIRAANQNITAVLVVPALSWAPSWNATWGNAGDVLTCTIVIQHTGGSSAAAYNINIAAKLQPYFILLTSAVTSSDATSVLGSATTPGQEWNGIATTPMLVIGQTLIITFRVTLNTTVVASTTISSSLQVTYTSSPVGGVSSSIATQFSLPILPAPSSQLLLLDSSLGSGSSVSMGEQSTYLLTITVPRGTTLSPSIVFNVPAGLLEIRNVTLQNVPFNIIVSGYTSYTISGPLGNNVTAVLNFTSIVNHPSSASDSGSKIQITVVVLMLPSLEAGSKVQLTSQFYYSNGTVMITEPVGVSHAVGVFINQPSLTWDVFWNQTLGDAGDVIGCTIVIQHTPSSSATAYNIDVSALLGPHFELISTSIYSSNPSWTANPELYAPEYVGVARIPFLHLEDFIALTFSASVNVNVLAGASASAQLACIYHSAPVGGYKLILDADIELTISPLPETQLVLTSTSNSGVPQAVVSVGEYITYQIVITIPDGTILSPSLLVTAVSSGLQIVNVSIASCPANIVPSGYQNTITGNHAVVNFTNIVNNPAGADQIVIQVVLYVLPSTSGSQLVLTSSFAYSNGQRTMVEGTQSTSISVVQPALFLRVMWNASTGDAGDVLRCSIAIKHDAVSASNAYQVTILAKIAPYFSLINSSVTSSAPLTSYPVPHGWDSIGVIQVFAMGATADISFNVVLTKAVNPSSVVSNLLTANYTSTPNTGGPNLYPLTLLFIYFTILFYLIRLGIWKCLLMFLLCQLPSQLSLS